MSSASRERSLGDKTWIVIPLYNERTVIGEVVHNLLSVFPNVVCVDDGSSDGSAQAARAAGAVVLEHVVNLGQGAALQTGIRFALSDTEAAYFVTFDADGQHRIEDAFAMVQRLDSEPIDVVIGSRFLDKRTRLSFLKRTVLKTAAFFQWLSTGARLTDAHNGLRAMNRHAADSLKITQNRMAHASEMVADIARHKLRYVEHPVHIIYTDYSRAKGQSLWNSVNILSDMLFK